MVEQFDFLRYADDFGLDYRTRSKNLSRNWLLALECPFCGGDHKYHMGIPADGNRGSCWRCGGHSLYNLLQALTPEVSYPTLLDTYGDEVDYRSRIKTEVVHKEVLEFPFAAFGKVARRYWEKRGFDPDFLQEFYGVRDGGTMGDWRFRSIIPILHGGKVVSYQGRAYADLDPKYKFLPDDMGVDNPKHILYNVDNARGNTVIVVEGVPDCWRLAGDKGQDVVATLGITVSEEQVLLLKQLYTKVYTLFDPEPEAWKRSVRLATRLSAFGVDATAVDTEKGYDLGDTPAEEAEEIRKELLGH